MKRLMIGLFTVALAACGTDAKDDDGSNNGVSSALESCNLEVELSGAVSESIDFGDAEGCSSSGSGGMASLAYNGLGSPIITVGLDNAVGGATGDGITGWVRYMTDDGAEWVSNDCTIELTKNELADSGDFGDWYVLEGSGQCATAAEPRGGGADGMIELGEFVFAGEAPLETQ